MDGIPDQVKLFGDFLESTARGIDLVIINGGANDLEFEEFLNPTKYRSEHINFYDPLFGEYFDSITKS